MRESTSPLLVGMILLVASVSLGVLLGMIELQSVITIAIVAGIFFGVVLILGGLIMRSEGD